MPEHLIVMSSTGVSLGITTRGTLPVLAWADLVFPAQSTTRAPTRRSDDKNTRNLGTSSNVIWTAIRHNVILSRHTIVRFPCRCLLAVPIFAASGRSPNKLKTQLVNFFNYVFHSTSGTIMPLPHSPHSSTVFLMRFYRCNRFSFYFWFFFFFHPLLSFAPPVGTVYYAPHAHTIITIRIPKPTTGFRPYAFVVDLFRLRFFSRPFFLSPLFIRRNLSTTGATIATHLYSYIDTTLGGNVCRGYLTKSWGYRDEWGRGRETGSK